MPSIVVNGVELSYVEHGAGPEPLLFLHGFLTSSRLWEALYFPHLPEKYHAYAPDLRGHGRSNAVTRGCALPQIADDMREFARRLGLKQYVAIGVSMGGGVALQLALDRVEELKAVVLISSVTPFEPIGSPERRLAARMIAGRRWLLRRGSRPMFVRDQGPLLEAFVDEAMRVRPEAAREFLSPDNKLRHAERLGKLRVPALVIAGGRDRVVSPLAQIRMAQAMPSSQTVTLLPEEGHAVVAENPERILHELRVFLRDLDSPPPVAPAPQRQA